MKRVIKASLTALDEKLAGDPRRDILKCTFTLGEFLQFVETIRNNENYECYFEPSFVDCGDVTIGANPSLEEALGLTRNNRH